MNRGIKRGRVARTKMLSDKTIQKTKQIQNDLLKFSQLFIACLH